MKEIFEKIWQLALPYQDKREDAGHAEVTLSYATLLVGLEQGNEDIVIPAIILHDLGWSRVPRAEWMVVFDSKASDKDKVPVQLKHQAESVKLAGEILKQVGYPVEQTEQILEIISQHDTRKGFISKDEGLVRDADKLWRFSKTGFEAGARRRGFDKTASCARLETDLNKPDYISSAAAKRIALEELELRRKAG